MDLADPPAQVGLAARANRLGRHGRLSRRAPRGPEDPLVREHRERRPDNTGKLLRRRHPTAVRIAFDRRPRTERRPPLHPSRQTDPRPRSCIPPTPDRRSPSLPWRSRVAYQPPVSNTRKRSTGGAAWRVASELRRAIRSSVADNLPHVPGSRNSGRSNTLPTTGGSRVAERNYDHTFWEQLWAKALSEHADKVARRPPSAHLVAEVQNLRPGRALDAGCRHGAEALWLAVRGWHVTAVDYSSSALAHGRSEE